MLQHKVKEKSSLSFSKSERQTLLYKLYVKWSDRYCRRFSRTFDLLLKQRKGMEICFRLVPEHMDDGLLVNVHDL